MTEVERLREGLDSRGIAYRAIGRMTAWTCDGIEWSASEMWDGRLRLKSYMIESAADVLRVAANVAEVRVESDVDGCVGHAECSGCGASVGPYHHHCHRCGAALTGGWRDDA